MDQPENWTENWTQKDSTAEPGGAAEFISTLEKVVKLAFYLRKYNEYVCGKTLVHHLTVATPNTTQDKAKPSRQPPHKL